MAEESQQDGNVAEEAKQVIDDAVGKCIDQDGVHVTEVSTLGWTIITTHELDEDERLTIADIAEALRVRRASTAAP